MELSISPLKLSAWLMLSVLVINGFAVLEKSLKIEQTTQAISLFHSSGAGILTSWFSSLLLLISAFLLLIITKCNKPTIGSINWSWLTLSLIFFYLSLDKAVGIHEYVMEHLEASLNAAGIHYLSWVIVEIPLLIILVLLYSRFLFHLSKRTIWLFIIAAFLYVFGAIGMDIIDAVFQNLGLHTEYMIGILDAVEDLLENLGIVVFLYALLHYLKTYLRLAVIRVDWI